MTDEKDDVHWITGQELREIYADDLSLDKYDEIRKRSVPAYEAMLAESLTEDQTRTLLMWLVRNKKEMFSQIVCPTCKEDVAEKAAAEARIRRDEREKVLEEKSKLIRDVISKDQSGLAEALAKIRTLAKGYDWIPAGEWGSYDYTQHTIETLQKECGYLLAEIEKISYEGLRDSGNRVIAHVRACEEAIHNPATPEVKEQIEAAKSSARKEMAKTLSEILDREWMCDLNEIKYILDCVANGNADPFKDRPGKGDDPK